MSFTSCRCTRYLPLAELNVKVGMLILLDRIPVMLKISAICYTARHMYVMHLLLHIIYSGVGMIAFQLLILAMDFRNSNVSCSRPLLNILDSPASVFVSVHMCACVCVCTCVCV